MKGPFCGTDITTDEGFKKLTKRRVVISWVMVIIGILTLIISEYAKHTGVSMLSEKYQGIFSGMGAGLIGAALAQVVRFNKLLKDEAKLREARILATDERCNAINDKALKEALAVLIFAIYVFLIVGFFVEMSLTTVMMILLGVFFVAFLVANTIYSKRM